MQRCGGRLLVALPVLEDPNFSSLDIGAESDTAEILKQDDALRAGALPRKLYHYTSTAAKEKIVQSGVLKASRRGRVRGGMRVPRSLA